MRTLILIFSAVCLLSLSSCATRVVTRPATVTVIKTPPKHYKIVRVKGKRYYFWNGKHYKKTRKGYVVVRV
ncbi:DUF6515 family protein [Psychroserpens luteolus]|uniref:DUF6515 family protein n=1 Tax=Psychroserpens luteolus TaxID=2855840 RepID=UPI001E4B8F07|nr:DUF6515 family protein [Psychroserpens luteolus]MCD2258192.1 hypothetical protein [Psychroserpens luteolus]